MVQLPNPALLASVNGDGSVVVEAPDYLLEIARQGTPPNRQLTLTLADVQTLFSLLGGGVVLAHSDPSDPKS